MHDVVAHSLSMISVQASVGAHVGDRRPEQATAALLEIKRASRAALADLRATLSVLRGDEEESTFSPSLRRLPELVANAEAAGLRVRVDGDVEGLPAHVDAAAYRILQESMTNTVRHARRAGTITIHFTRTEGVFELTVLDDGEQPASPDSAVGHGLHGIRERAKALGGTAYAGPRASGGFKVSAHPPVKRGNE